MMALLRLRHPYICDAIGEPVTPGPEDMEVHTLKRSSVLTQRLSLCMLL